MSSALVKYFNKHRQSTNFIIGLVASIALVALTSLNLTAQGLYYDEVHQAPAAFAYLDQNPAMFNRLDFYGLPLLNMTYSGAIKSNIYGLYLMTRRRSEPIFPWKTTGIVAAIEKSEGWQELPVEAEIENLRSIEARKFVRTSPVNVSSQ